MPDDSLSSESAARHLESVPAATEPGAFWGEESFTVARSRVRVLFLSGDIDMRTDSLLREALARLHAERADSVVIDLTDVGFCSISAFASLLDTARAIEDAGARFVLVAPSAQITRVSALIWPDLHIARHPTIAAAIHAICTQRDNTSDPLSPARPGHRT